MRSRRSRNGRTRDHWADRGFACNRRNRRRRGSNNVRGLSRQGNDAARRRWCRRGRRWCSRRGRDRDGRSCRSRRHRSCMSCGWRCGDDCRGTRWSSLGGGLSLLALEDGLERVAGLGDLGEIKLRLDLGLLPACARGAASTVEVAAHLLGLIGLDRAGVRLPSNADRFKRIENRPALYFQFSCQIVDSNFAHPSLFASLRP